MTIQHTTIDCTPGYPTHNCWLYTWLSNTEQFTVHLVIHRRTVACTPSKSTWNKMTNIPTNGPVDLFSFDTWITRFQSALDKNHTFPISVGEESHFLFFGAGGRSSGRCGDPGRGTCDRHKDCVSMAHSGRPMQYGDHKRYFYNAADPTSSQISWTVLMNEWIQNHLVQQHHAFYFTAPIQDHSTSFLHLASLFFFFFFFGLATDSLAHAW